MPWPLAGRGAELRFVAEALAEGTAGGVVIAGPAGVGKTRLVVEAAQLAAARGCTVAWVRATRSAASIPLGAFAPLLPATERPEGVELLARARHALAEHAAGRRLVLCVDDGPLLDDASAALVHQLVAAGEAFAIVTVRQGDPVPDALRALWKDELCAVLELQELSRDEVDGLLAAGLGGPVAGGTVTTMWELTRGNPLFLRELARHGVDRGLLSEDGGVWRWRGRVEAGTRLAELVDLRIDGVGPGARGLLELVAVGGPLELGLLGPGAPAALEALERAELVERRTDGRRRFVDVGHPLHGEAVRARLTPTRLDALRAQLADAVEERGARRGGDLLRLATWRLESGATTDGALFARAAFQALAVPDPVLAERLARVAVQEGAGFRAELALGRALAAAGRGPEADALFAGLATRARDDAERAEVAVARARNLFWAVDRADDADAVLQAAERLVRDDALRHELTAQRVRLTAANGRPETALAAARPLLEDGGIDELARTTAAMGAVEALFTSGRTGEAIALAERWLPVARRRRRRAAAGRARAARHAGDGDAARRSPRRGDDHVGAHLPRAARAQDGRGRRRRGELAGPDLARAREGPDRAAVLPRERGAAARRGRRRDAGLRARGHRAGRRGGRRARDGARGDRGDGAHAAGAQGVRGRARARTGVERRRER